MLLDGYMEAAAKQLAAQSEPPKPYKKPGDILSGEKQDEIRDAWIEYVKKFNDQFASPQAQNALKHR